MEQTFIDEPAELNPQSEARQKALKLLHYKVQEHRLEEVWNKFTAAGFAPILIKGWAAAQVYPEPAERLYTDVDLVIAPERFAEAEIFSANISAGIAIDIHKGARHLDSLPFNDLFENSVFKKCGETDIRVPRDEDHLRILCVHWLNDGGADRERLRDIYNAVNNRAESFDWERCLGAVSPKRRRWIVCAVALAHRYLDLPVENTPLAEEVENIPQWLIRAVEKEWAGGVRLLPLEFAVDNRQLWEQIKKRIPPNPVQATIEMDGHFNDFPRLGYQTADIFLRLFWSVRKKYRNFRFRRN